MRSSSVFKEFGTLKLKVFPSVGYYLNMELYGEIYFLEELGDSINQRYYVAAPCKVSTLSSL